MGRYTSAVLVPFVIGGNKINDIILELINSRHKNGWNFRDSDKKYKYKEEIVYCDLLEKNNLIIYVVNEAPYDGDTFYCVFSKDKNTLIELCKDWELDPSDIEENEIVKQTL